MIYENPQLDDSRNPNVTHEHPLREMWRLLGWSLALLVTLWLLVRLLVASLPYWVDVEDERRWFAPLVQPLMEGGRRDAALQQLADTLAADMGLKPGAVEVSVQPADMPNAFATLGGQVIMMSALLECLPSEEAVAAVLAHEIAHVVHRDPLQGASQGVLMGLLSAAVFGNGAGVGAINQLLGMKYSRDREEAADAAAVHALARRYGSIGGMQQLFEVLSTLEGEPGRLDGWSWLSTHPDTGARIQAVHGQAARHRYALRAPQRPNPWRGAQAGKGCRRPD